MKPLHLLVPVALVLATAGFVAWRMTPRDPQQVQEKAKAPVAEPGPAPDAISVDPAEVFQRAFWKRPSAEDRILHAERREWGEEGRVTRWQWFLEVEPSPALLGYLRDENAFRMTKQQEAKVPSHAPSWFTRDTQGMQVMASRDGIMQVIFTDGDKKLYAIASGGGFQAGEPEKLLDPPADTPNQNRLPNSPPPPRSPR